MTVWGEGFSVDIAVVVKALEEFQEITLTRPIVTLTTDYGNSDHLVGAMKGVILGINPEAEVVDITHQVLAFDLLDGAMAIGLAYKYFPPKTIHLVVVDPGVGTPRRPILVRGDNHFFVAPDNGVLSMVYEKQSILTAWHITAEHYFLQPVSNTFHGRDIFAPVAAWLSKAYQFNAFGEEITDIVKLSIPKPKVDGTAIKGMVLKVDNFGNLITNITAEDAPVLVAADGKFKIRVGKGEVSRVVTSFAAGGSGEMFGIIGSSGSLEISTNKGNAARGLGANRRSEVVVEVG